MTRDEIIGRIRSRAGEIRALGASALFLFGSAARDELREDSDIDVFIDREPKREIHLRRADEPSLSAGGGIRARDRPHDPRGTSPQSAGTHRGVGGPGALMQVERLADRLDHILEAINGIEDTIAGLSRDTVMEHWTLRSAVERGIQIISEAAPSPVGAGRCLPRRPLEEHPRDRQFLAS
jgi:Nucleotidyltransferase domain